MTDDLVKRLRQTRASMLGTGDEPHYYDCHAAAEKIERLRAELAASAEKAEDELARNAVLCELARDLNEATRLRDDAIKERDEAIREIGAEGRKRGYAEAERDAAIALLREAGEALEPFAEMVRNGYDTPDSLHVISVYIRHCVAARATLAKIRERVGE